MKRILPLIFLWVYSIAFSQTDKSKTLEQRARAFHAAISQADKEGWKNYITQNFTQALIDRPMRAKVVTAENDNTTSSSTTNTNTQIEAKLAMFERLHDDFAKGKISNVNVEGDKVTMTIITDAGMTGVFRLESESNAPWKIEKLGIEVEANN